MVNVYLDVETRSTADLRAVGAHRYAEHGDTELLCVCWCVEDGPVQAWRRGQEAPADLVKILLSRYYTIHAWNASFERAIFAHCTDVYWPSIPLSHWSCTQAKALVLGLPASLAGAAEAMRLRVSKDKEGHDVMMRLARPRRIEGDCGVVWWPENDERYDRLVRYCQQDVKVTRAIDRKLAPLSPAERDLWELDQRINDLGMRVDLKAVKVLAGITEAELERINERLYNTTNGRVEKVSNVRAIREYAQSHLNETLDSLDKATVGELLAREQLHPRVRKVLEIRQYAGKSSIAKLKKMKQSRCSDGRVKGLLQYHGASTGRWAGRGIQPQNLPRRKVDNAAHALSYFASGSTEFACSMVAPGTQTLDAVSALLRSCLTAAPGHVLLGADYSAIEARVLAWLAKDETLCALFAAGEDVYMHDARSVASKDRQLGKLLRLGLGYGMGAEKFIDSAASYGIALELEESQALVRRWRDNNQPICEMWLDFGAAAIKVVEGSLGYATREKLYGCELWMTDNHNMLKCRLPSFRCLSFIRPAVRLGTTPWGAEVPQLSYETQILGGWRRKTSWGGLLVQNIVQAVARDVMAEAMLRLDAQGWPIVLTVHDEVVTEVKTGTRTVDALVREMERRPVWAKTMPIAAEGWQAERYGKY